MWGYVKQVQSSFVQYLGKLASNARWMPAYTFQRVFCRQCASGPLHIVIALANHFEPYIVPQNPKVFLDRSHQLERVRAWCRRCPSLFSLFRDSRGRPFRHTYFYPAEHCDPELLAILAEHCRRGWGEIEIHLHHGVEAPDTSEHTREVLVSFRDFLASIGCLSRTPGSRVPRYAFVHGNWALANSANGRCCGVDSEMQILAETGCYADFTLPSAPGRGQVAKVNSIYECKGRLYLAAPHRRGRDLCCGSIPTVFPIIVQGPLMVDWSRKRGGLFPALENSALTAANPPTLRRFRLWMRAGIAVRGRPEWVFVKLHCHGMDPRDTDALLGKPMFEFLRELVDAEKRGEFFTHFVTAREMTNIILAACTEKSGDPSMFRNSPYEREEQ